jgi:hypothetical protein
VLLLLSPSTNENEKKKSLGANRKLRPNAFVSKRPCASLRQKNYDNYKKPKLDELRSNRRQPERPLKPKRHAGVRRLMTSWLA